MYTLFINLSSRQRQDYFAAIVTLYTGVGTMFNHKIETCAVRCSVISGCSGLVSERKLGIFFKIKEGENYNHRNTLKYFEDYNFSLLINPAHRGRRDWEK